MSGKGCVLRMHAASIVNDTQQPRKAQVSAGAKAGAANDNSLIPETNTDTAPGNASIDSGSSSISPTSAAGAPPANNASISAVPEPPNGVNAVTYNSSAPDGASVSAENNSASTQVRGKIKLPLPSPGTGIRHNVIASAGISSQAKGVPRGITAAAAAVPAVPAVKASPRTAEDIAKSARLRKESRPGSSNTNNINPNVEPTAGVSPRAASTPSKKRPVTRPDNDKMDEDDRDGNSQDNSEGESDSMSGSLSDDDSISTSSSFDSEATSDLDDSNSSMSSAASSPQHEQMEAESETVSPDLEYAVVAHRKKGLLLSRLSEVSARGTLAVMDLARRGLGVNDVALIEQAILVNPKLAVLKLGYNDLGDVGAHSIANALCIETNGNLEHRSLGVLDLSFNGIGDSGCESLAMKAIAGNYNLRTLFLTGNDIGEKGAISIAGALVHGCYLCRLHLTANKLGPEGTKALATAVAEVDARLQLQQVGGPAAAAVLGAAIDNPNSQRMEHLFLGSTNMLSTGFYAIPSMLLSNTSLQVLCLTDNNIDDNDMAVLAQAFTQNKNIPLESLLLSFNQITDAGVESLMNSIWGSPTLKEIKLDNNKVTDRGAQLCAVVCTSIKLEKLDISFNAVTTVGIRAIMKSLSEDTNMRSLGISGIAVDLNAAKAISFALAYNTVLETVFMDNCQVGYSAQRHITAGIVSNQKAPLKLLTGFLMCPIAVTLGMPALPEEWTNEKVLAFVRLMWRNWGKKRGPSENGEEEEAKGPAPPAAVAAAAKIALASLGANPGAELYVEPRRDESYNDDVTMDTHSPLMPQHAALIERTYSGRWQLPNISDNEGGTQNGFLEAWTESSAFGKSGATVSYQVSGSGTGAGHLETPLDNPEQRNRNLRWLRTHFKPLLDVGKLPFNNADMWQLHQYYFSPPYFGDDGDNATNSSTREEDDKSSTAAGDAAANDKLVAPPPTPAVPKPAGMGKTPSFHALSAAVQAADLANTSHKRRGHGDDAEGSEAANPCKDTSHSSKRTKSLKPRIAYYPRIRAKLESLGTKPLEQTLSLLRKLKYVENVIFPDHTSYEALDKLRESEHSTRLDVEMILLDLI